MKVIITLTLAGVDTGPFSLYSDTDGFVAPFAVGVGKIDLTIGYTSEVVPDGTSVIRVISNSQNCTNYIDIQILTTTTTTTV